MAKCEHREELSPHTNMTAESYDRLTPIPEGLHPAVSDSAKEELRDLAYLGLRHHYGENPPREIIEQVEKELGFICQWKYESIFIAVHRLISGSQKQGFPVGFRGSVGASLVAFLIGITGINPLQAHYRQ